jgi:hypothetical protein
MGQLMWKLVCCPELKSASPRSTLGVWRLHFLLHFLHHGGWERTGTLPLARYVEHQHITCYTS